MNRQFYATSAGLLICCGLLLVGCTGSTPPSGSTQGSPAQSGAKSTAGAKEVDLAGLSGKVMIDGSSTVFPVSEAVAEEFQNATQRNVQVTVGISGTGGGFKKLIRNEIDVTDASRPILEDEIRQCKENGVEYIELPVCFDALTIAVNPKADWVDSITVAELKKMWEPDAEGQITTWAQVREGWPDEKLLLYGAGTDSGTFDYFTEAINGKAKSCRSDFTASEDDNTLVQGIEGNQNALGFIPFAYYEPNKTKLKALKIDWEKDDVGAIEPSAENVLKGIYNPLSRPLFIYVNKKSAERPEVKKFVEFYLTHVKSLAAEVKYLPLPDAAYAMALDRFAKLEVGTGFGGKSEVGLPVEEILKRTPTH